MKKKIYLIILVITILSYSALAEEPAYFADANLKATFEEVLDVNYPIPQNTIYVDDDAVSDPGPFDPQISDTDEDGTLDHPFDSIHKAVDAVDDGYAVLVFPGIYSEKINFSGKAILLQGIVNADGVPVLENPDGYAVAFENGEGPDSILKNFIIKNSFMAILIDSCSPTISNLTIVENQYDVGVYNLAQPDISNSILWGNLYNNLFGIQARYSCIEGADHDQGNFSLDPLFADPDNGDYHLLSEHGRFSTQHYEWVLDEITSPCIDTGDPDMDPLNEPIPNGGRINVGAYGGTPYASMSWSEPEEPVYFPDANLKAVVEQVLGITEPTPTDMLALIFLNASDKEITDLTGLEYASKLNVLNVTKNQISEISAIAGLTNLTTLNLEDNLISDISVLAGLTNLINLYLENNQISDISMLAGLTNLWRLDMRSNQISDISVLAGLTNLEWLWLDNNQISDISALDGLSNLEVLYLQGNQISDISVLAGLYNLGWLNLQVNQITDISALSGLKKMRDLGLYDNKISNISDLTDLTNLTGLALGRNNISDISVLAGMANLKNLHLGWNHISDISVLAEMTNLETLMLSYNPISDISALTGLTNLWGAHLDENQLTDISALAGLTNLRWLTLRRNQISDISALIELKNLWKLDITGNQISDISALADMTNLSYLLLGQNPLNQDACDIHIPQIRENNPGVDIKHDPCSN